LALTDIQYCEAALPQVSRTFAPTIRMLPEGLRLPVTTAYLLCRIADTVEDSETLSLNQKKNMLQAYSQIFLKKEETALQSFLDALANFPQETADDRLVHDLGKVMRVYRSFSPVMQSHIAKWVVEMSLGMHKYAQSLHKKRYSFLKSMKELDEYTYYVAGTVGYLLTELFSYYSKKITPPIRGKMEKLAGSFGKGLQLVNIIRDMTVDLRRGQSYIPDELLQKYKLTRETIYEQKNAYLAEQLFNELIRNAVEHLDKALDYILLIPKEETRIRLFCMLPLFWAMRTLQKIQFNTLSLLDSEKVKVTRTMIRKEYFLALINMRSNRLMRRHYGNLRKDFEQLMLVAAR